MRWLVLSVLLLAVSAQDFNWGKKVTCFTVHGQVFCPGCNSRSGLSCPRRPENRLDFESCLPPSMLPPRIRPPLQEATTELFLEASSEVESEGPESTTMVEVESPETWPSVSKTGFEPTETFSSGFSLPLGPVMPRRRPTWPTPEQKLAEGHSSPSLLPEMTSGQPLQQEVTTEEIDWQLMLYLYRMLRENKKRQGREVPPAGQPTEDELETCNWNGDCPCPLICCRRGEGCPKKCVVGILLPPPWG